MKSDFYFYATILSAFLVVVLLAYLASSGTLFQDHKYKVTAAGVDFVSDTQDPGQLISGMKAYNDFVVSPQFSAKGPENSYMAQSLTAFNSVLIGNGRKVIVVGRVLDENGTGALASCETNLGDPKTSKTLTAGECNKLLSDSAKSSVSIFVSFPDTRLQRPRVLLSANTVRITPSSSDNAYYASYVFLTKLFPDAASQIAEVNTIVKKLS